MVKQRTTEGGFTVTLRHPLLVLRWSAWMLQLGTAIGMHWHRSHTAAICVPIAYAVMIVIQETVEGFVWCTLAAWWLGRCQGQNDR